MLKFLFGNWFRNLMVLFLGFGAYKVAHHKYSDFGYTAGFFALMVVGLVITILIIVGLVKLKVPAIVVVLLMIVSALVGSALQIHAIGVPFAWWSKLFHWRAFVAVMLLFIAINTMRWKSRPRRNQVASQVPVQQDYTPQAA